MKKTRRTTGKDTVTQNYNDTSRMYWKMNWGCRFCIQLMLRFGKLISVNPQRWELLQGPGCILISSRGCFWGKPEIFLFIVLVPSLHDI